MAWRLLLARLLMAALFLYAGSGKIFSFADTQQMMADRGLPAPALLLLGNIVFQLVGGLSLVLGFRTRIGAIVLIAFLIPTTLVFHAFWADPGETTAFLKNTALIGGLLAIAEAGAGSFSLDARTAPR